MTSQAYRATPYRVVQLTETGEEFIAHEARNLFAAEKWITLNEDNYPESIFYSESVKLVHEYWGD